MVTFALFAMCGLMGLAIDLGWSFYVHKTARAAADSAALAAVKEALAQTVGTPGSVSCTTAGITCSGLIDCSAATGTLQVACQYAQQNGFSSGGNLGHQKLRIEADAPASSCRTASPPNCVPTAPGVAAYYWVHVVATETVPQLFSAMLGNTNAVVSADATAALVNEVTFGALRLLNHADDPANPDMGNANVVYKGGGGGSGTTAVSVPGGILMSSQCHGSCGGTYKYAGNLSGGNDVSAPFTYVAGDGIDNTGTDYINLGNNTTWTASPQVKNANSDYFQDPKQGIGQPPMNSGQASKPYIPVLGGTLTTAICNGPCGSGNYYATDTNGNATGLPITLSSGVTFNGGSFGDFVFFGGINSNGSTVNFGPGRYFLAGTLPGNNPVVFNNSNTTLVGGNGSDAGRILVLTDAYYHGDSTMAAVVAGIPNKQWQAPGQSGSLPVMQFGEADFKSGNNGASITLYGLNPDNGNVPDELSKFTPVVVWQDQHNSYVQYDSTGTPMVGKGCGGSSATGGCPNTPPSANSPKLTLWAGSQDTWGGAVYQPRGAWAELHGGASGTGSIMLVTGAIEFGGGAGLVVGSPVGPLTTLTATLVH
jgi:Flp pilus assembly protein TadG